MHVEWGPYEPPGQVGTAHDADEFRQVIHSFHPSLPFDQVSVFEIADSEKVFLKYLAYLHARGLRPSIEARLIEMAHKLMPEAAPPHASIALDAAWSLRRRRLLVALSWPSAAGGPIFEYPFPDEPDSGYSGVYGRAYWNVWSDIRSNFAALAHRVDRQPGWKSAAAKWDLSNDVFREAATRNLVTTPQGRRLEVATAEALISLGVNRDRSARLELARRGFLLNWWDVVALAECTGFSFEPVGRDNVGTGHYIYGEGEFVWDRRSLVARLSSATPDQPPPPEELHLRITAGGLIQPPADGSKYRALFDRLDAHNPLGASASVTLDRDDLSALTSQSEFDSKRRVRGARGRPGLPVVATKNATWWYGPWNPNESGHLDDINVDSFLDELGRRSHTRAWMAAGFRARPRITSGTKQLERVRFEPVEGRGDWWPWREQLRAGTYDSVQFGFPLDG